MSRADLLLFRGMRGIFWVLLVVGGLVLPVLVTLGVAIAAQLELFSAGTIEEVAAPEALMGVGFALTGVVIALIGSVVMGATAGSVDFQRGVLRDLVLTGKPRWQIVVGRSLAAFVLLVATAITAFVVISAISFVLSPVDGELGWERIVREAGQYLVMVMYVVPFAAGIAMLVGSRGPAIAVYFVVALVVDNVLAVIPKVGEWWTEISLNQADSRVNAAILETEPMFGAEHGLTQAVAVVAGWSIVAFAAGLVRLSRRDL